MTFAEIMEALQQPGVARAFNTALLIVILLVARGVAFAKLRGLYADRPEVLRRWMVNIRMAMLFVLIFGVVIIWAEQLRTLALSVVAITAAIVVATKELILCVSGSILRTAAKSFRVGDRIEVNGIRGDVIDQRVLSTTILEIGPGQTSHQHTGRAITIPNAIFVSAPVINETFTKQYVLHVINVPIKSDDDFQRAEQLLLEAARAECASYFDEAREHFTRLARENGLEPLNIDPRVVISMPDPGRLNLMLRMPTPARRKGRVEQEVLRRFLPAFRAKPSESDAAQE